MRATPHMRSLLWALPVILVGLWFWSSSQGHGASDGSGIDSPKGSPQEQLQGPEELVSLPADSRVGERSGALSGQARPIGVQPTHASTSNLVFGVVHGPNGKPSPNTMVGMAELDANGVPKGSGGRGRTQSDDQGRFELEVPKWAFGRDVLLVARSPGFQPASTVLKLTPRVLLVPHSLALSTGSRVWGQVIRGGQPVSGVGAHVDIKYLTSGIFGLGEEAWWIDGRLENKVGSAKTDDSGVFLIEGMGRGEFRLAFGMPAGSVPTTMDHVHTIRSEEYTVFDVSPATLNFFVRDANGPVIDAFVHVTGQAKRHSFKSTAKPTSIAVGPGDNLHVQVLSRGHNSLTLPFVTPPARGVVRDFELFLESRTRPSLSIRLPGAEAAGVQWIALYLYPIHARTGVASSAADSVQLERVEGTDTFRADVVFLDPGDYRLQLIATALDPTWFPLDRQTQTIHLSAAGEHSVDFSLRFMASFAVDVSSQPQSGDPVSMHMRVLDSDGKLLMERDEDTDGSYFTDEDFEDYEDSIWAAGLEYRKSRTRDRGVPGPIAPPPIGAWGWLPSGGYTLEIRAAGHEVIRKPITLAPGVENEIPIILQANSRE